MPYIQKVVFNTDGKTMLNKTRIFFKKILMPVEDYLK